MTAKRIFSTLIIGCLIAVPVFAQKDGGAFRIRTVVLDPGHGGKDPGNLGTGRYKQKEKDIALDVAKRVGDYIKETFPDINVIYTRDSDVFIGLNERADVANKADADLFISIHCNAAANSAAHGVETFALGLHASEENLKVAMKENQSIFLEDDYESKYEGFDPNSPESIIAMTIMQSAFLEQSLKISSYVQGQFKERVGRKDRGVKQAGFLVLRRTSMPSILIELGFLTNPAEEDFLNSENGRAYMSSAIYRGFKDYKQRVESTASAPKPEVVTDRSPVSEVANTLAQADSAELERLKKQQALEAAKAEKERLERLKAEQDEKKRLKEAEESARKKEADRLAAEKAEKERQLQQAKKEAEEKEKAEIAERVHREAVAEQARKDFQNRLEEREKARQDSVSAAHMEQLERKKRNVVSVDDTASSVRQEAKTTAPGDKAVIPALADKPLTPEEAELLYLEKRKRELEERIERMRSEEEAKRKDAPTVKETSPPSEIVNATKNNTPAPSDTKAVEKAPVLSVQILTSASSLDVNSPRLKGEQASHYSQDGLYKYTVGKFSSMQDAVNEQRRLRGAGFDGAFVVAFLNGERITLDRARELLTE
jgi:N-acetylmuramoyl-L-alanine amidase